LNNFLLARMFKRINIIVKKHTDIFIRMALKMFLFLNNFCLWFSQVIDQFHRIMQQTWFLENQLSHEIFKTMK